MIKHGALLAMLDTCTTLVSGVLTGMSQALQVVRSTDPAPAARPRKR